MLEKSSSVQSSNSIKIIDFEELKSKIPNETELISKLSKERISVKLRSLEDDFVYELDSIKEYTKKDYQSYSINVDMQIKSI